MNSLQSDFLQRVSSAIENSESCMLVYRKQGYESKPFRLQLKSLAGQHGGVLLEDRHTFTFVSSDYSKLALHRYKETHEVCERFTLVIHELCAHYQVSPEQLKDLCKGGNEEFRYMLMMICYFLKVSEDHVLQKLGKELCHGAAEPKKEYTSLLEQCRHEYHTSKRPSEVIDKITESIKEKTQHYAVYSWTNDYSRYSRSLF